MFLLLFLLCRYSFSRSFFFFRCCCCRCSCSFHSFNLLQSISHLHLISFQYCHYLIPCCAVLYCTVLFCSVHCNTVLCHAVPCQAVPCMYVQHVKLVTLFYIRCFTHSSGNWAHIRRIAARFSSFKHCLTIKRLSLVLLNREFVGHEY